MFEFGIFSSNSYVYYLTRGFIASTRAFNLPTHTFNLVTRTFSLLTPRFELASRRFELVACVFELVTREFELATPGFELVTRNSCFTFPQKIHVQSIKFNELQSFNFFHFCSISMLRNF